MDELMLIEVPGSQECLFTDFAYMRSVISMDELMVLEMPGFCERLTADITHMRS